MPKEEETTDKTEAETEDDEEKEEEELESSAEAEKREISNIDLKNLEFQQFMQVSDEGGAPVLERIEGMQQQQPVFFGGIPQTSPTSFERKDDEDDSFKYISSSGGAEDIKYMESGSRISNSPERVDFGNVGRESGAFTNLREAGFTPSETNVSSQTVERTFRTERFDVEKAGRENPVKIDESKYKIYKPSNS